MDMSFFLNGAAKLMQAKDQGKDPAQELKHLLGQTPLGKELKEHVENNGLFASEVSPRRSTDVLCTIILFLALGFLGYVQYYAFMNGDLRKLHAGFDFLGNLCGASKGMENRKYLYYCRSDVAGLDLGALDLVHPVCRESCPTSADSAYPCYAGHTMKQEVTNPATGSFQEVMDVTFKEVSDYPSYVFAGRYCMPLNNTMMKMAEDTFMNRYGNRLFPLFYQLINSWQALLASAGVAVILGFLYLIALEYMAGAAVYGALILPLIAFTLAGTYMILRAKHILTPEILPNIGVHEGPVNFTLLRSATTGNSDWDFYVGIGSIALAVPFVIIICCCRESIRTAIGCVDAACECLKTMPSVLLNPLLSLFSQLTTLALMLAGFMFLLACGEVKAKSLDYYVTTPAGGSTQGLARSFTYNEEEHYYIAFYIFMIFWIVELVGTVAKFALIYATELWYFTPYFKGYKINLPLSPLLLGLKNGLLFHLGSLAFGAFLIAVLRIARIIGAIIAKNEENQGNKVSAALAKATTCCLTCFQTWVEFISKNAYMEVAMHSKDFCSAAKEANGKLTKSLFAVGILNGVTWVFTIAGVGTVGVVGALVSHLLIVNLAHFSDPASEMYVPNPAPVVVISGIFSALCALVFMSVFDTVSDTILYCFVVDDDHHKDFVARPQYAPAQLSALINQHKQ